MQFNVLLATQTPGTRRAARRFEICPTSQSGIRELYIGNHWR